MTSDSWPHKGDKAFTSNGEESFFHIETARRFFFPPHAEAFKFAAEALIDQYESEQSHYDELFFPIAHLYRHCLELKLKAIVVYGLRLGYLQDSENLDNILVRHSLLQLWQQAAIVIEKRFPNDEKETPKYVESIINEIHQVDPDGQRLRYDRGTDGKRFTLENLPTHVSPTNLKRVMHRVCTFFDACTDALDDALSADR